MTGYKTLKKPGTARKEFKNSVFIGYARPVKDEREAREFIEKVKALHADANHNVSGYLIKTGSSLAVKYDDDGEPAGSSGKPVFKVLELKEVQNAAVVVTRYFGGIKLGYGGLTRAYRETAAAAIEDAGIVEVFETACLKVLCAYPEVQKVKKLIENYGALRKEEYQAAVEFTVEMKKEKEEDFIRQLADLTKNRAKVKFQKE